MTVQQLVNLFSTLVINPLLLLLFALGFLFFVYGLVEFLWNLSQGAHEADKGKMHMLWGIFGMFIMSSAYAIIKVLATLVGQQI